MPYPKRETKGQVDCRPRRLKNFLYPLPPRKCNKKCIYWKECDGIERFIMPIEKRIKKLKNVLGRQNHFFSLTKSGKVMLIFEKDDPQNPDRIYKSGDNIAEAIKEVEDYVVHEQKMGALPKGDDKNEEDKK